MPELDGFELAEIIREHPALPEDRDHLRLGGAPDRPRPAQGLRVRARSTTSRCRSMPELLRAKVSVFAELYRKTREVERLNRELEQRVAERTAELEASTPSRSELADELREADRRKDEFLAMLAHELRNPLAPIAQRRRASCALQGRATIPSSTGAATSSSARPAS